MQKFVGALIVCALLSCAGVRPATEYSRSLAQAATNWGNLLDRGMPQDLLFGVVLGGKEPYERNPDEMMAPASVSKILTSGAALAQLGENFQYTTLLRWQQSPDGKATNVEIIGQGDPTWGMKEFGFSLEQQFDELAKALAESGVKEVGEEIKFTTDPRWQQISFPAGWKEEDSASCDGSQGQGFNISANCAPFVLKGANRGAWAMPGLNVPVALKIISGAKTRLTAHLIEAPAGDFAFEIRGTWAKSTASKEIFLPIHDTRPWANALLRRALRKQKISVHALAPDASSSEAKEMIFQSPKLSFLIQPFNKNSVNFLGDALLKTLAAADPNSGPSLHEAGLEKLRAHLSEEGLAAGHVLNDGSGLSRTSRVNPSIIYAYLSQTMSRPYFTALLNSLPVAGVDGTLQGRMTGPPAAGVLRAKTGTLDGVYNLAGYVPHGETYVPFVMLSRTAANRGNVVRPALDRVGQQFTRVHSAGPLAELPTFAPRFLIPFVKEHSGENRR